MANEQKIEKLTECPSCGAFHGGKDQCYTCKNLNRKLPWESED